MSEALGLKKQVEPLRGLMLLAESAGWALPHKKICWISERHNICRLQNGMLHCEGGPAIQYPDGWSIWALSGVRVEQWMAETPHHELDPKKCLSVENAEQRRELIRRIGVERLLHLLPHKTLCGSGDGMYELLSIDFSEELRDVRVLKMRNPSIGIWHLERVADNCETVQESINWRASGDKSRPWNPEVLT